MPQHTDQVLNRQYHSLCAGIGHLFICFSQFEGMLSAVLRLHLANHTALNPTEGVALSSAIYGSMRYKTSRDTIKRLMKLERVDAGISAFIEGVFAQGGNIEEFRNKIAHETVVDVH